MEGNNPFLRFYYILRNYSMSNVVDPKSQKLGLRLYADQYKQC